LAQKGGIDGWSTSWALPVSSGLALTFQRFPRPASGVVAQIPSSLGALPVGVNPKGKYLLPVADDEAFWIGLGESNAGTTVAILIELADGRLVDAISGEPWSVAKPHTVTVPEQRWIEGIPRPDGQLNVFSRARTPMGMACRALRFFIGSAPAAQLDLVDYATFTRRTGLPAPHPLDPDAGYKGWRLP
jgi:hypothetical protein